MADYIIQKAIDRKDMSAKALLGIVGKDFDVQPKYDGCHLVVILNPDGNAACWSATGEPVRSCDHIVTALFSVLEVTEVIAVCGEAWMPDAEFPEISGAFRRHSPQPQLMFAAFDVVSVNSDGVLSDARPYRMRTTPLRHPAYKHPSLVRFNAGFAGPINEEAYAKKLKAAGGYDGAILHDLDAPYKVGRCRQGEVIKIKPLLSYDLLVTGVEKALGTKTGKNTGALVCRFKDGKYVRVATGLSQLQVDTIDLMVGQIVEVEAMAETKDGLLREPRFKGVRLDKAAPDF
jgi:DNA ligase-1